MPQFQRIIVRLLATGMKVAVGVFGLLWPLLRFLARGWRKLGRILFAVSLPVFRLTLGLKRTLRKLYAPLEQRSRILHLFTRRYFFHLTFVGIALTVVTASLNAYEVKRDEFVYSNVFTSLTQGEEYGEIEAVQPPAAPLLRRYADVAAVGRSPTPTGAAEVDVAPKTTAGGSAVVKPFALPSTPNSLAAPGSPRLGIVTYTVQDGDTISDVAAGFGLTINTILWENNLTPYAIIRPGQLLTILPLSGVRHAVAKGETLSKIAARYRVETSAILAANKLASADDLTIGERLLIPGGVKPRPVPTYALRQPRPSLERAALGRMIWPAACRRITQYFGWRHSGLDIACTPGSAIFAAEDGQVIKAQGGWNGGYGIMVVLQHAAGIQTLYGHARGLYVRVGEQVTKGQAIAGVGSTGRSSGSHLHFEVRHGGYRKNPLSYIR